MDAGADVGARGDHDHRGAGALADLAAHLVAVLVGQPEVEQHDAEGLVAVSGTQRLQRLLAAAGVHDLEAVPGEDRGQGGGDMVVVLDEQQSHASPPPMCGCSCLRPLRTVPSAHVRGRPWCARLAGAIIKSGTCARTCPTESTPDTAPGASRGYGPTRRTLPPGTHRGRPPVRSVCAGVCPRRTAPTCDRRLTWQGAGESQTLCDRNSSGGPLRGPGDRRWGGPGRPDSSPSPWPAMTSPSSCSTRRSAWGRRGAAAGAHRRARPGDGRRWSNASVTRRSARRRRDLGGLAHPASPHRGAAARLRAGPGLGSRPLPQHLLDNGLRATLLNRGSARVVAGCRGGRGRAGLRAGSRAPPRAPRETWRRGSDLVRGVRTAALHGPQTAGRPPLPAARPSTGHAVADPRV